MTKKFAKFISHNLILLTILLIGLFFRIYNFKNLYIFEHDQDLYSWIVKDILSGHLRLIGQLTSIDGVFIGPLYYYFLVPFYRIFNYNPLAAILPATIVSLAAIVSVYYVFWRLFEKRTGLIAAFIYSVSFPIAIIDRWIVPTQLVIIWSIWFLYLCFSILKNNPQVFFISGILTGLIWHIHVGLVPILLLVPICLVITKQKIPKNQIIYSIFLFFILSLPYFVFELKHDFLQTRSLISAMTVERGAIEVFERFKIAFSGASIALSRFLVIGGRVHVTVVYLLFFSLIYFFKKRQIITKKQIIAVISWIFLVVFTQFLSKRDISDYYFNSIIIIAILLTALLLSHFIKQRKLLLIVLSIYFLWNLSKLAGYKLNNTYEYKKGVVDYIKSDASRKSYPCIAVNYVADFGSGVGFRYLLWYENLATIIPNENVPVYKILIPQDRYKGESDFISGLFGLKLPEEKKFDFNVCSDSKYKQPPLFLYTD